jgi:hypothetical protein
MILPSTLLGGDYLNHDLVMRCLGVQDFEGVAVEDGDGGAGEIGSYSQLGIDFSN